MGRGAVDGDYTFPISDYDFDHPLNGGGFFALNCGPDARCGLYLRPSHPAWASTDAVLLEWLPRPFQEWFLRVPWTDTSAPTMPAAAM